MSNQPTQPPATPTPAPKRDSSAWDVVRPFVIGGLSGMFATTCIQPIDCVKVRIQILGEAAKSGEKSSTNPLAVGRKIIAEEGVAALYKGLSAGLLRQATYTTARLGVYNYFFEKVKAEKGSVSFGEKFGISLLAGFFGAMVGNPADLILIRFQSDSTLPVEQRRNYKGLGDAFVRIIKDEGFFSLWKGSTPTVFRALAMNAAMLTSNDELKERITKAKGLKKPDNLTVYTASAISGVLSAACSLPFDNIKTKFQKMKKGPDGLFPYSSFFDCFKKSVAKDGITGLWIGFFPTYCARIAPHITITLILQDKLTKLMTPTAQPK